VELQAVAQREGVREAVLAHLVLVHHLGLDLELRIDGEQRVVDHVAMVARDVRGGGNGIQDAQIRLRDELQHFLFGLRERVGAGEQACSDERRSDNAGHVA
jgi:hypothetical protein